MATTADEDSSFISTPGDRVSDDSHRALSCDDVPERPLELFSDWLDQAIAAGVRQPNGMVLATVGADGLPSARVVLLRQLTPEGLTFYTNRDSRKGRELAACDGCCLTFWWEALERQVRVEGRAEALSQDESEAYFRSRPRGSQIGAWASQQSRPLADRVTLEGRVAEFEERFAGADVPLPDFWGGYHVVPERVEFWQGRASRLHDRICYLRVEGDPWQVQRLAP